MNTQPTIWSVGGGKGGIGKSVITANIGVALAQKGKSVVLVDADLGGANLHIYFGFKQPKISLLDFIKGRYDSLEAVALPTAVPGLRLISGASEFLGIANPAHAQKQKIINHIKKLKADYILVDLGAGSTYNILDFFSISGEGIVVLAPEPAALQNAYVFLKGCVYRRINRLFAGNPGLSRLILEATDVRGDGAAKTFSDLCERIAREDPTSAEAALDEVKRFRPKLLLNMAAAREDQKVMDAFKNAAKAFLGIDAHVVGTLFARNEIKNASRLMRLVMLDRLAYEARREIEHIVSALTNGSSAGATAEAKPADEPEAAAVPGSPPAAQQAFGFNDKVAHQNKVYHVQTEVTGGPDPVIQTVIYFNGRIFFSKKNRWQDLAAVERRVTDIRAFVSKQHRTAIAAIKMNKFELQA